MPKLLTDQRGVTSIEYALLAASIALVLFEVMQVPAEAFGAVLVQLFEGLGGHGSGG